MLGYIATIKKVTDMKLNSESCENPEMSKCMYGGFHILTTSGSYYVLISNDQIKNEIWGYRQSVDNLDFFKGTKLQNVEIVKNANTGWSECDSLEVKFTTVKGSFTLIVYNFQNGTADHYSLLRKDNKTEHMRMI